MDLNALKALDSADIERLIDAMYEHLDGTESGDRSGHYEQTQAEEVSDIKSLIAKLRAAQ